MLTINTRKFTHRQACLLSYKYWYTTFHIMTFKHKWHGNWSNKWSNKCSSWLILTLFPAFTDFQSNNANTFMLVRLEHYLNKGKVHNLTISNDIFNVSKPLEINVSISRCITCVSFKIVSRLLSDTTLTTFYSYEAGHTSKKTYICM